MPVWWEHIFVKSGRTAKIIWLCFDQDLGKKISCTSTLLAIGLRDLLHDHTTRQVRAERGSTNVGTREQVPKVKFSSLLK